MCINATLTDGDVSYLVGVDGCVRYVLELEGRTNTTEESEHEKINVT